jgi:hypothetical protein
MVVRQPSANKSMSEFFPRSGTDEPEQIKLKSSPLGVSRWKLKNASLAERRAS